MSRPARPDERPKFGQIWRWAGSDPLMAMTETDTGSQDGVRWEFMRVLIGHDQGDVTWMWWTAIGDASQILPGWELLDD